MSRPSYSKWFSYLPRLQVLWRLISLVLVVVMVICSLASFLFTTVQLVFDTQHKPLICVEWLVTILFRTFPHCLRFPNRPTTTALLFRTFPLSWFITVINLPFRLWIPWEINYNMLDCVALTYLMFFAHSLYKPLMSGFCRTASIRSVIREGSNSFGRERSRAVDSYDWRRSSHEPGESGGPSTTHCAKCTIAQSFGSSNRITRECLLFRYCLFLYLQIFQLLMVVATFTSWNSDISCTSFFPMVPLIFNDQPHFHLLHAPCSFGTWRLSQRTVRARLSTCQLPNPFTRVY